MANSSAAIAEARKQYGSGTDLPVAEQPTYIAETAARKFKGILSYFVPCALTATAYGAIMHFGWGIPFDIALDCGVPAVWASREAFKDLGGPGKEIVERVEDFIKDFIPFGEKIVGDIEDSSLLPEDKEAAEALAKEQFREDIIPAAVLGVGADSIRIGVTNGAQFIGSSSAKVAGNEVANAVFKELEKGTLKELATNDRTLFDSMKTNYAEKISDKILANKTATATTIDDVIVDSSKVAYREMGEEMGDLIVASAKLNHLAGDSAKLFDDARTKMVGNLFEENQIIREAKVGVGTGTLEGSTLTTEAGAIKNVKTKVSRKMTTNIMNDLQNQSPALKSAIITDPSLGTDIEKSINKGLMEVLDPTATKVSSSGLLGGTTTYKATIDPSELDDAIRRAMTKVRTEVGDQLAEKVVGKKIGQEFAEKIIKGDGANIRGIADEIIDPKAGAGKISKFFTNMKQWRRFISLKTITNLVKNLAKGVAGGVLSNYVGYQGWKLYWDEFGDDKVEGAITSEVGPTKGEDVDGDGVIDNKGLPVNQKLERGQTYRIAITATEFSGKHYEFVKLEKKEDFDKMDQEIKEGKAVLWEEPDCKNFKSKGVGRYLGNLAPVPSKTVMSEHVIAYYNYNSVFADAKQGDASSVGDDLYEDELAAALFVDAGRIEGCSISKTWYIRGQDETEEDAKAEAVENIKCAAGELRQAKLRVGAGASFKKIAAELVKGQAGAAKYSSIASEFQEIWKRFRIVKAS